MDPNLYAASIGAPAAPENTLGASQFNEISNMGAIGRKLPTSTGLANESVNIAQQQVEEQKRAAAAAEKAAKDKSKPSAYTVKPRKDGGFGFYDPDGNEISAYDYARATNKDVAAVLKNSQNPIDKGFINDWKNLNNYIKYKQSGDKTSQAKAKQIEQQVKQQYKIDLHKMDINDVTNKFIQNYPTVFGGNQPGFTGLKSFVSAAQTQKQKGGLSQQTQDLFNTLKSANRR